MLTRVYNYNSRKIKKKKLEKKKKLCIAMNAL